MLVKTATSVAPVIAAALITDVPAFVRLMVSTFALNAPVVAVDPVTVAVIVSAPAPRSTVSVLAK